MPLDYFVTQLIRAPLSLLVYGGVGLFLIHLHRTRGKPAAAKRALFLSPAFFLSCLFLFAYLILSAPGIRYDNTDFDAVGIAGKIENRPFARPDGSLDWYTDQPEGNAMRLAPFIAFFGPTGIPIFDALLMTVSFGLFVCAFWRLFGVSLPSALAGAGVGAFAVSNYFMPLAVSISPISAGILFSVALFIFSLASFESSAVFLGVSSAILVGVRHEYLLFLVLLFAWLAFSRRRKRPALLAVAGAFLALSSVYVLFHLMAFGSAFVHETQRFPLKDAMYRQCIGPFCFQFNGLLNFQGAIVRTPTYPYPVFIYLPLLLLTTLGVLPFAAFLYCLLAGPRREGWETVLGAGILLLCILLFPMENWDINKTTLFFAVVPAAAMLAVSGLLKATRSLAALAGLAAIVVMVYALCSAVARLPDFPEDARWYRRSDALGTGRLSPASSGESAVGSALPPFLPTLFPQSMEAAGGWTGLSYGRFCVVGAEKVEERDCSGSGG